MYENTEKQSQELNNIIIYYLVLVWLLSAILIFYYNIPWSTIVYFYEWMFWLLFWIYIFKKHKTLRSIYLIISSIYGFIRYWDELYSLLAYM